MVVRVIGGERKVMLKKIAAEGIKSKRQPERT
jgi:hypothetical protein